MKASINLAALMTVAGGLGAAALPGTARANCNPSVGAPAGSSAPLTSFGDTQFDPSAEYKAGVKAFESRDFREAKNRFMNLIPYAPKEASVYYLAGASKSGLGDYKGAVKLLEKAVKLAPDMLVAQQDLAVAYAKNGNVAQAQAMLAQLQAKATACNGVCEMAAPLIAAISTVQAAMAS